MKKILLILFLLTLATVESITIPGGEISKKLPTEVQTWNETICYKFLCFLDTGRGKFENVTYQMCNITFPGAEQREEARRQLGNLWQYTNYYCLFSKIFLIILPDFVIKAGILTLSYGSKVGIFLCNGILQKGLSANVTSTNTTSEATGAALADIGQSATAEVAVGFVALVYLGLFILIAYYSYQAVYGFTMFSRTVSALFGILIGYVAIWMEVWPIPWIIGIAHMAATCTIWFIIYLLIIIAVIFLIGEIIKRPAARRLFREKIKGIAERAAKIRMAR